MEVQKTRCRNKTQPYCFAAQVICMCLAELQPSWKCERSETHRLGAHTSSSSCLGRHVLPRRPSMIQWTTLNRSSFLFNSIQAQAAAMLMFWSCCTPNPQTALAYYDTKHSRWRTELSFVLWSTSRARVYHGIHGTQKQKDLTIYSWMKYSVELNYSYVTGKILIT